MASSKKSCLGVLVDQTQHLGRRLQGGEDGEVYTKFSPVQCVHEPRTMFLRIFSLLTPPSLRTWIRELQVRQ